MLTKLALFSLMLLVLFSSSVFALCSTDDDCPATCSGGMVQDKICTSLTGPGGDRTCEPIGDAWSCPLGRCDAARVPPCARDCSSDDDCPSKCSNGAMEDGYCYLAEGKCYLDTPRGCPSGKCADVTTCAPAGTECVSNNDCSPMCSDGLMYNANCIDGECTATRPLFGAGGSGVPCEGGLEDKCAGVTCEEQYCQTNTRYYNGQCSNESGECVYNNVVCPLGCNASSGFCIQEQILELTGLVLEANKQSLVLNGRDAVKVQGSAYSTDGAGNRIPFKGELRFDASGEASGSRMFGPSAIHVSVDPSATVKDGSFSFFVSSEDKISQDVDLTGAKIIVSSQEMPSVKMEIALKSPAPMITTFKLKNKPTVWQDSYGVFEVAVEDPDTNIKDYTVKSEYGEIRLYGVEWGEEKQVTHPSTSPNFEFGWKAPKFTQEMKLDYTKAVYERIKGAVQKIAEKAIDDKLKARALTTGGKSGVRWTPDTDEMKALVDAAGAGKKLETADTIAKFIVSRSKLSRSTYNQVTEPIKSVYEKGEAFVELYKVVEEAKAETAEQAQEIGAASTEDASFFEYAARVGIIGIQGYQMYDGVMTAGGKLAGEESGGDLMSTAKDAAKEMTIGVMQDSLKHVADYYKAARAKMLSLPFIVKVQVTDGDGYTATKGVLVEVEGYERVVTG